MTSIILLSGMLGFGFSPDAFAGHVDNKGKSLGCINGVAKNNPHCVSEPLVSPCDKDNDGVITVAELLEVEGATSGDVATALVEADLNNGGTIDTVEELALLITVSPFEGC